MRHLPTDPTSTTACRSRLTSRGSTRVPGPDTTLSRRAGEEPHSSISPICETIEAEATSMKLRFSSRLFYVVFAALFAYVFAAPASAEVLKIVVDDTIQPITAEYIDRAIQDAVRSHDQALLIEINTPGGLLDSTRDIIAKILASPVPVIIYVTPSGSRAASAGFFILES